MCILGNPWPPVLPKKREVQNNLVNVLLSESRRAYREEKYKKFADDMAPISTGTTDVSDITEKLDSVNITSDSKPGKKEAKTLPDDS